MLQQDEIVLKSNAFINAKYKFTIAEQRVFLKIVSKISPSDEDFKMYELDIQDIMKDADVKNKTQYNILKKAINSLRKKDVVIPKREDDEILTGLILKAETFKKSGKIKVLLDPELKPYFLKLKESFTKYNLAYALSLRSNYSVRIYELMKQYEKIGTRRFKLKELRETIGVGELYSAYGNFKKRVLLSSQKEINNHTDIEIDFSEKRVGRSVEEIIFTIRKQEPREPLMPLEDPKTKVESSILELHEYVDEKNAKRIEAEHNIEYIKHCINYAKKNHNPKKGTLGGFLIKTIDDDWGKYYERKKNSEKKKAIAIAKDKKTKVEKDKIQKEREEHDKLIKLLTEDEYQELYSEQRQKMIKAGELDPNNTFLEKIRVESEMVSAIKNQ